LTQRGMTVIEFSQPIINDSGTDFIVYSNSNKPCSVLVSTDWNGPWSFCAYDTGSIAVDLSIAGVSLANFVRLNDGGQSYDLDAIEGKVVNAPALVLESKVVIDSPPGGNGDGRLDPAEMAELVLALRNAGRVGANNVTGLLRTDDEFVSIIDSTGGFGDILPDSVRSNISDRFAISADSGTPQEHIAEMKVYLYGTDYSDSIRFCIVVGELRIVDPIPDNSQPTLYRAYDEVDTLYREHPAFEWVEVRNLGTRLLNLSDDETRQVNLPPSFGPFVFYGVSYHQLSICSNGWIAPGYTTVREWRNTTLPNTSMPPLLAANWDDLYPPTGNGVWYYHDTVNHRFIIEWDSVHYVNPGSQWDKFEIILYDTTMAAEDGNSKFCFQYLTANQPGTSATIGIQDHTKTKLIQAVYNGSYHRAASPWIPGRSLKFSTDWQTGVAEVSPSSPFEQLNIKPLVNPSKGTVNLRYSLPSPTRLVLVIYDRCGRAVQRFDIGEQHAGRYCLKWNLTDIRGRYVGAGVYWVKLITEQGSVTTKMTILR
ncbi:MAG: FlgD immunoglobulin-like domain containing protein, partial [bacterium]